MYISFSFIILYILLYALPMRIYCEIYTQYSIGKCIILSFLTNDVSFKYIVNIVL